MSCSVYTIGYAGNIAFVKSCCTITRVCLLILYTTVIKPFFFFNSVHTPLQPTSADADTSPLAGLMLEERRTLRNGKYMRFGRGELDHLSPSADIEDDNNVRSDAVLLLADSNYAPDENKRQEIKDVDGFTRYEYFTCRRPMQWTL